MVKAVKPQRPPSGRTNLASCIVASIFLIFLIIIILILFFTLLKPNRPKLTVNTVQLPSFSIGNNSVNFTFSQYVSVHNPNKGVFSHYDSSLQLLYCGNQVGFMYVPAGKIDAGRTQYMAATFSVLSFPFVEGGAETENVGPTTVTDGMSGVRVGATMELESRLEMAGRVRVMHFFTHHVDAKSNCKVDVSVSDGSVLGFHC